VVSSGGVASFVGCGAMPAAAELGGLVAVSADHCDAAIPGGGQVHASLADQIGIHVDSHDGLLIPDDARDQGCVITGASTDLQYAMPRGESELAQHDCHHRRLRRRTDRQTFAIRFDHDSAVLIGLHRIHLRQERMPGDPSEGSFDCGISPAGDEQLIRQLRPRRSR
jgi:hypothetical protein